MIPHRHAPTAAPDRSDEQLAAAVQRGDLDALAELYRRYATSLMAVAYRILLSRDDAEDVLHDVFVGLPEALRRYQERGVLGAWLKRVTARVALSRLRDDRAAESVSTDMTVLSVAPHVSADTIALRTAVSSLPPSLRAVVVLKEIEGFSHAEIAQLLGVTKGASEVRLHRALRQLRKTLSPTTDD